MRLKLLLIIAPVFLITHLSSRYLLGQEQTANSHPSSYAQTFGKPLFIFNTYTFASDQPGKTQLDVYVTFVNDILQFVKDQEQSYRAKYEIMVEILDEEGNRQDGDILKKEIISPSFDETNSRNIVNRNHFSFVLSPGAYDLHLELTDLDTKRHLSRDKKLELRNYQKGNIALSDLMFVDTIELDSLRVSNVIPNMRKTLEEPSSEFGAYYELYCFTQDSIKLRYSIYDLENNVIATELKTLYPDRLTYREFIPLKKLITVPGQYVLIVEARSNLEKVTAREGFFVQYSEALLSMKALESSTAYVRALKYIAPDDEFSKIEKAPDDQRVNVIEAFWKERDPSPETDENELKEEFYRRLKFTVRHFSVGTDERPGWDTDRGKIYIIYGSPSEVQRRGIDLGSNPYEVWYYREIDKRFIFLDKSGFGNYRLIHKD
jgi:GWxTD domain-containing protein